MSYLKVALLQLAQTNNPENLDKGLEFCRQAKAMGADIALFPEMWNIGYQFPEREADVKQWQTQAIDQNSEFFVRHQELAADLDMAIALTYLERGEGLPRNTVAIIDRTGKIVLTYAKVHTCDFGFEALCSPGEEFYTCELNTAQGNVNIGAMICYDREFPESARILMLQGAEIILIPNACGMEENRKTQLRARAYENMVGVALANYAGESCKGHSVAYDGIGFTGANGRSRNTLIVEAGEAEGIYLAKFNLEKLRNYRSSQTWGNAYRKPRAYSLLLSEDVKPPFVRKDSRRGLDSGQRRGDCE